MDNPAGRFVSRNLAKVPPDAIFDRLPALQQSTEPASQFTRGVVGDIALPTIRNDIYEARKQRPGLMGTIDWLRSTTPAGWAMTKGIQAFGSPEVPDIRGTVAKHLPAFLAATAADPEAATAGPYGNVAKQLASTVDVSKGNPSVAAANWAHIMGAPYEQAVRIRHAFPDRLTPDMGSIWQGIRKSPQNLKRRADDMRRLLPGATVPAEKEGAVQALARLSCEKQADFNDYLPLLAGAGLGGVAGHLIGRFRGSKHPWQDTLTGAGLGGLVGMATGANRAAYEPPVGSSMENLADAVSPYYKDVPGGFEQVVTDAEANQAPYDPSIATVPWKAEDLKTKMPVTTVTEEAARADPNWPKGVGADTDTLGHTTLNTRVGGAEPPAEIKLVAPASRGKTRFGTNNSRSMS